MGPKLNEKGEFRKSIEIILKAVAKGREISY